MKQLIFLKFLKKHFTKKGLSTIIFFVVVILRPSFHSAVGSATDS